ncbi:hydroxymethylglutaryl-CoA lyase [Oceanobacillus jeddahense]|uniref:hydroxymethylglutaryl-CoA lyase n=1 Tax=Oceanobacillus jeddahense TaxID=1462527 RepID=UPI0005960DA3|nr:hydroxymethylglutaryl-CoA lyase [Oceanobacillus jeddahense]
MDVKIQEVISRDGFQMEKEFVPTEKKVQLINELSETGVHKIEVTSFVSPKAVPQLKDASEVATRINRTPDVTYVALIANLRGAERALDAGMDEVNLVMSASTTHNKKNVNKTHEESLFEFQKIMDTVKSTKMKVNGTVATAFGCPFEGDISEDAVQQYVNTYLKMGMNSITLADTTGMANPVQVKQLVSKVKEQIGDIPLTLHFHNTRGMGLVNVIAAMEAGANQFDASLGGIGGCPFAPGATGNICTEDLVHMLDEIKVKHNTDLDKLISLSSGLTEVIGRDDYPGQVVKAGKVSDLHTV